MCRAKKTSAGSNEEIERLRRWVEKGKAWAQSLLGDKYEDGVGVEQSYQQAAELYELAATQGDASAQYNLGLLYVQGQGVEQSNETARELWIKAAHQGHEDAIGNLQKLDKSHF